MSPRASISVLVDNRSARPGCRGEWGLSLAVRLPDGGLWLWDTGKTPLLLENARAMGVDVTEAKGLALSHGHYDHTGGVSALLAAGFRGSIHAHPSCALSRWAKEPDDKPRRYIGPPAPLPAFHPAAPVTELAPGLTLLTDIPRRSGRFQAVAGFSLDRDGREADAVADDAFLVLDSTPGPVVILGCCHSGLDNSLSFAAERLGHASFHAVLGGLHLFEAGPDAVEETAAALRRYGVGRLIAGHCTGRDRLEALRPLLPGCAVAELGAGQVWEF